MNWHAEPRHALKYAGIALTDVFELATYAWEDDVSDLPLTYAFAYVSGSADETDTSSEMVVRAALETSKATDVYLPQVGDTGSTAVLLWIAEMLSLAVIGHAFQMVCSGADRGIARCITHCGCCALVLYSGRFGIVLSSTQTNPLF